MEELLGYGCVMEGGNADGGGVESETGGEEIVDGGKGRDAEGFGGALAELWVGFDERGEVDEGRGLLELAIDAQMITAEGAGADDRDAERGHGYFFAAEAGDSTASRQRA